MDEFNVANYADVTTLNVCEKKTDVQKKWHLNL